MKPITLVPEASRRLAARLVGEDDAQGLIRYADSQMHRAMRVWDLEPLAPASRSSRSIVWYALREDQVLMVKMPVTRGEAVRDAHVALSRRALGPEVLDSLEGSGTMLIRRYEESRAEGLSYGDDRKRAECIIAGVMEMLSSTPAVSGHSAAEDVLRRSLVGYMMQPGRSVSAQAALDALDELEGRPHLQAFRRGKSRCCRGRTRMGS